MLVRACVLHNPRSGSADQFESIRERLGGECGAAILESESPESLTQSASDALRRGFEFIIAAGGDGTVNAVVNGLAADFDAAQLGVLPLGTGNDFCRTLGIPNDLDAAIDALLAAQVRTLDLYVAETKTTTRFGINLASGGFTGQVHEAISEEIKANWGPLAYLRGVAGAIPDMSSYQTTLRYDGGPAERVEVFNLIVANGRMAGSGYLLAPQADPEDGQLDVNVVLYAPLLDLAEVAARLLTGNYLQSEQVLARRVRELEVASTPGMWFSIDGDLSSNEPTRFRVLPQALRVVVGPGYTRTPDVAAPDAVAAAER